MQMEAPMDGKEALQRVNGIREGLANSLGADVSELDRATEVRRESSGYPTCWNGSCGG